MGQSSRIEHTTRNIVWGFAYRLVALFGPFVVRSILIWRLGVDYLGLSSFYASLLQVLNLAELGFSSAVAFGMYRPLAEGDQDQVVRYVAYLKRVYRVVGAVLLVLGICIAPVLGLLVKGPLPSDVNIQLAFFIYVINTALGYFLFAYKQTLLIALQRKDLVDKIYMLVTIGECTLQCILLLLAPNFYTYALVLPLSTLVANLVLSRVADRLVPQYALPQPGNSQLGSAERSEMRKRIAGLLIQKTSMVTRESFAGVMVTAFVGLAAVACFTNYFMVVGGVLGLLATICVSMTASVGNSVALESPEKNFDDLRLFVFLYALLSIVCSSIMLALYQPFMALWMGSSYVLPFDIAVLFTLYFYVRTMGDMRTVYVDATGIWWKLRWRALVEAVANVVLCVVLVYFFDVRGAIAALLISLFVCNFLYGSHLTFVHYFGLDKAGRYYLDSFLYLGVGVVVCATSFALASLVPEGGVMLLLARGLLAFACSTTLVFVVFARTQRFSMARIFVEQLIVRDGLNREPASSHKAK